MTPEELETSWSAIPPPTGSDNICGRRAVGLPNDRPVYLALDGRGQRHLLIQIPEGTTPINQRGTNGLDVLTSRFRIASNAEALYVDLVCVNPNQHATFSAVAHDFIRSLQGSAGPLRDSILGALARWRLFWSAGTGGMSPEDSLGLFGELWFLRRWLGLVSLRTLGGWQATSAARHDFQWPAASVEVKTTAVHASGDPIHRITGLDQLSEPEHGQLYLFSLQTREDALAANTVHSLVAGISAGFESDLEALAAFNEKLAARGYTPADDKSPARKFRVIAERLYRVDQGFPRLTRSTFTPAGLPAGVVDLSYGIDLSACQPWLVAASPTAMNLASSLFDQPPKRER